MFKLRLKLEEAKPDKETEKDTKGRRCFRERMADCVCREGREVSTGFGNREVTGGPEKSNFTVRRVGGVRQELLLWTAG